MAKQNKKPVAKKKGAPKAPAAAPQVKQPEQKKPETKKEEEKVTTVQDVATNPRVLMDRKRSGLSLDGQVRLLDLTRRVFVEETDPELQFPQPVRVKMNKIVAIGIVASLAEHSLDGTNEFAAILNRNGYPMLEAAAAEMGIRLPKLAVLPAPEGKEDEVELRPNDLKISKETKDELKKEKAIREGETPELDPKKVDSDEEVTKALEYMFAKSRGKSLSENIHEAVGFMKDFRYNQASKAENAEEAKARYDTYTAGDWMDDMFGFFKPTVFYTGIGRGMCTVAFNEGNPVHAFLILRDALKNRETGKPEDSDTEVAYLVRSITKWVAKAMIESNEKAIEALDPKQNAKEIEHCKVAINNYNNAINCFVNPSFDLADNYLEDDSDETAKITKSIIRSYYPLDTKPAEYKNFKENIQQRLGCIINLFRDPNSQSIAYKESNITELVKYTEEELAELKKAEAKAKAAAKESESKKD